MLVFVFSCCSSDLIHSTVPSISVSVGCMVVDWIHGFQCHIYIQYRGTKRIEAQLKTQPSLHFSLLALSAHKFHIYIISCYFIHAIRKYVHIYSFAIFFFLYSRCLCLSLNSITVNAVCEDGWCCCRCCCCISKSMVCGVCYCWLLLMMLMLLLPLFLFFVHSWCSSLLLCL